VRRQSRIQIALVLIVLMVGLAWPTFATLYTDWLWMNETGYQQVFTTSLVTRLGLGAVAALAVFVLLFLNLRIALHHFEEPYLVLGVSPTDGTPIVLQRRGVSHLATFSRRATGSSGSSSGTRRCSASTTRSSGATSRSSSSSSPG
jgi:hypothetical protein